MTRFEGFLHNAAQVASNIYSAQKNIVAVKLHPKSITLVRTFPQKNKSFSENNICLSIFEVSSIGEEIQQGLSQKNLNDYALKIREMVIRAKLMGHDSGISIPNSNFENHILKLPFISEDELEEKGKLETFWENKISDVKDLKNKVFKYQILNSDISNNETTILFSFIPKKTVQLYVDLLLDAGLKPVTIENEIFSIISRIQSQTSSDNLNEPQLIVHLSPINNNVILFADNLVTIIPILISDLDEALLLQLSELNDISTELWDEFGIRVGENIRQAIDLLYEKEDFPLAETFWLISEYNNISNLEILLKNNVGIMNQNDMMTLNKIEVPPSRSQALNSFKNNTLFISLLNIANKKINIRNNAKDIARREILRLNYLPSLNKLIRYRQFAALNKLLIAAIGIFIILSGTIMSMTNLPKFVESMSLASTYEKFKLEANLEKKNKKNLTNTLNQLGISGINISDFTGHDGYTNFMLSLAEMLPEDAELKELNITSDGALRIEGLSLSSSSISIFSKKLINSGFVSTAPINHQKNGNYYFFSINTLLSREN